MVSTKKTLLGVCMLGALVAIAGCTQNGTSSAGGNNSPQGAGPVDPSGPMGGMSAPLFLNLRGPDPLPNGGNITIDVEIVVNEPIRAPITLQVLLPQGAQFVSGNPTETLSLPQAGKLYRQFIVTSPGPLAAPVLVRAFPATPSATSGFLAERQYPPKANVVQPPSRRPPVARPPTAPR